MLMDRRLAPTLEAGATKSAPTWRAAYSDRTAALMSVFSQLAYLPFEDDQPAAPSQPRPEAPGGRGMLAAHLGPDFDTVTVFNRDDTQAYLAVGKEFAVLAFRGTSDRNDWITNLRARLTPLKAAPAAVRVHAGFLSAFECCRSEIVAAVDALPPNLGLYITGHSLGGALAQIASAVLERDTLAACYTFGSPRVGAREFDRQVKCPHYRLINRWDVVPGVPPPWLRGYRHTGDPRLLLKGPILLRRDRSRVSRLLVDLYAALVALPRRRLFVVDDHMIWNYRDALERIALDRAGAELTTLAGPADSGAMPALVAKAPLPPKILSPSDQP